MLTCTYLVFSTYIGINHKDSSAGFDEVQMNYQDLADFLAVTF